MRRLLFVILILLLPLRSWVGDAMAMQMAMPAQHGPASGAMQHSDRASDPAHLHMSAVASAAAGEPGWHAGALDTEVHLDAADCEACLMCQTCHTVAVLQPVDLSTSAQLSLMSPLAAMHAFASAERALLLKPPIH